MNQADYEGSLNCGAYIQVTGPKGTVTVEVVDRCPECQPGDVDLSPQAFAKIADLSAGRVPISWHLVERARRHRHDPVRREGRLQPVVDRVQVRQHANIVSTLEVQVNGAWQALERQEYNYFLASSGLGNGPFTIRITDIYGQQLVQAGITLSPERGPGDQPAVHPALTARRRSRIRTARWRVRGYA